MIEKINNYKNNYYSGVMLYYIVYCLYYNYTVQWKVWQTPRALTTEIITELSTTLELAEGYFPSSVSIMEHK